MSKMHRGLAAKGMICAIVLAGCFASSASAAPLLAGATQFPAVGEADPTGGLVLVDSLTVPVAAPSFSGSLTSKVYTGDTSNPSGVNAYTFTYQFTNTDGDATPTSVHRVTISEFDSFLTDASYQTPAVGLIAPTFITRDVSGDVIGFSFETFGPGTINPGQTSAVLVVQTNSFDYAESVAAVIDGSTAMVAAFAPVAVPEPASVALLSLAALGLARRRR